MAESLEHRRLVLELANYARGLLEDRYGYEMYLAQKGHRFPQAISGYIPDLRAFGYVKDVAVEIVGEAETEVNHLVSVQLAAFIHYVEDSVSRGLVLAVPPGRKDEFARALRHLARDWNAVRRRVLIL